MSLQEDEKRIIQEALSLYVQFASQKMPPQAVDELTGIVRGIMEKLPSLGAAQTDEQGRNIPNGITEEWFDNVCTSCEQYSPAEGCLDPVTKKFPGKCDPILKYEMAKRQ
ncbi:MAG: hypothetical protein ACQEQV_01325 [Fibrobacterota bacterium]|jgi:hypothetical protein